MGQNTFGNKNKKLILMHKQLYFVISHV